MPDYPRVLHAGYQPIGASDNTGLTLASMFSQWPADRLLQVYSRQSWGELVHTESYLLHASVYPIDHAVRTVLGRKTPSGAIDGMNTSVERSNRLGAKDQAKVYATILNDLGPVRLPRELDEVVRRFKPDVLHTLLGSVRAMNLALKISQRYDLPIVPHYMDDWPASLHGSAPARTLVRARVQSLHGAVLRRSAVGLTIGYNMAAEYEDRYGIKFRSVGNSVAAQTFRETPSEVAPECLRTLRYVGGLHLGRERVIAELADRIANHPLGHKWRLELFCPEHSRAAAESLSRDHANVNHMGAIPHDQVAEVLASAGGLVFIESEEAGVTPFTRLSVSTKVPEYLASGRPVLCVGPREQASIDAFMRYGRGVRVGIADGIWKELYAFLSADLKTFSSTEVDERMVEEFSSEAVCGRLHAALHEAKGHR